MKLTIVAYGQPADPAGFDRHYANVHVPLVRAMPHLQAFEYSKGPVVTEGEAPYLIALLRYASAQDLEAALSSPEGQAALADIANFATGGVTVQTIDLVSAL